MNRCRYCASPNLYVDLDGVQRCLMCAREVGRTELVAGVNPRQRGWIEREWRTIPVISEGAA